MDILSCIKKRTSIRRFTQDLISLKDLITIIDAVRISPSAANLQPLEYIIVNKQDICDRIFPYTAWAGYLKPRWVPEPRERPTAYIAIVNTQPSNIYADYDVGIAMAYITLVAQALNIGSCILCKINKDKLKKLLYIPENFKLKALIALGMKNELVKREESQDDVKYWRDDHEVFHVPKKPLSHIIHEQTFTFNGTISKD
jgi:nitroreductase